jgi:hypothetical protein
LLHDLGEASEIRRICRTFNDEVQVVRHETVGKNREPIFIRSSLNLRICAQTASTRAPWVKNRSRPCVVNLKE